MRESWWRFSFSSASLLGPQEISEISEKRARDILMVFIIGKFYFV
jgi:hypothetical protein